MKYTNLKLRDEAYTRENFSLEIDVNGVLKTEPSPIDISEYYNFGDYISHQSENKSLMHWLYNLVKKRMFQIKFDLLKKHSDHLKHVLDFGCGTGEFLQFLKTKNIKAEGIEPTKLAFEKAKKTNKIYQDLKEANSTYDAITLFHVLEHVNHYDETIEQLLSKLNKNGLLLIAVPNYKSYDANYYKEKWAAWDVPRHLWHFSKTNIRELANRHNLELIKIRPMYFDAFYISMVSESYKGNSKLKGFLIGLISNLKALKTREYSSNLFLLKKKP